MELVNIISASIFVSLFAFIGGILLLWKKLLTQKVANLLTGFAAGVLLATAFFDLLPEALEEAAETNIFIPALFGIIVFFILERFLLWFHHHSHHHHTHEPKAILILAGDGMHNFIDGVAIAASFMVSTELGIVTTMAVIAHEIPHEIADFSVLITSGFSKSKALFYNFLSGLTALIGALVGYYFLDSIEGILPLALAFTAGMFIYIACSDLIPELHEDFKKQKNWILTLPFLAGVGIVWFLVEQLHHAH